MLTRHHLSTYLISNLELRNIVLYISFQDYLSTVKNLTKFKVVRLNNILYFHILTFSPLNFCGFSIIVVTGTVVFGITKVVVLGTASAATRPSHDKLALNSHHISNARKKYFNNPHSVTND